MDHRFDTSCLLERRFHKVLGLTWRSRMEHQRLACKQRRAIVIDSAGRVADRFARERLPGGQEPLRFRALLFGHRFVAFLARNPFGGNCASLLARRLRFRGPRSVAFRCCCLLGGDRAVPFPPGYIRLPQAGNNSRHKKNESRGDSADERLMTPRKLLQLIEGGGRTRDDRFVLQVSFDVRREFGRGP